MGSYSTGACLRKKEKGEKREGEESGTRRKMDCPRSNAIRVKVSSFLHDDAVGTVQIRGLRNFQYGKQSCNLSEQGCSCELWLICVIASSSVPFGGPSSLLIQGLYNCSKNFSSYLCLILTFKNIFLLRIPFSVELFKT